MGREDQCKPGTRASLHDFARHQSCPPKYHFFFIFFAIFYMNFTEI